MVLARAVLTCNVGRDLCYSVEPAYFTELFEPKLRYSGASVGPQVAAVFAGGFATPDRHRAHRPGIRPLLARSPLHGGHFNHHHRWRTLVPGDGAPRVRLRQGLSAEYDPTTAR